MKTKEELMQPRFKVINKYPLSCLEVGEVFEFIDGVCNRKIAVGMPKKINNHAWCEQYPAIFRPMQWYEDRKVEDMPEYVLYKDETSSRYGIHRVVNYDRIKAGYITMDWGNSTAPNFLPATEQDFKTFKQNNDAK